LWAEDVSARRTERGPKMVNDSVWPSFRLERVRGNSVIFGLGCIADVGAEWPLRDAKRILLVCSDRMARSETGRRVIQFLGTPRVTLFTGVGEHESSTAVEGGLRAAQGQGIDLVVSLGGGSAIGLGKALSLRLDGAIDDLQREPVPHVAIPTTYSGSEMTFSYGITDPREHRKAVFRDERALPALAVYDPELTYNLPARVTAGSGMNALAHCVEVLLLSPANPECRAVAVEGIRRITSSLPRCIQSPHDPGARSGMFVGSLLGGRALFYSGSALHHALCQSLGGKTGVSHGDANAIVLPHVLRMNAEGGVTSLLDVADALHTLEPGDDPRAAGRRAASYLAEFAGRLGLPGSLKELGVPREVLPAVAEEVFARPPAHRNPRALDGSGAILAVLEAAWEGGRL